MAEDPFDRGLGSTCDVEDLLGFGGEGTVALRLEELLERLDPEEMLDLPQPGGDSELPPPSPCSPVTTPTATASLLATTNETRAYAALSDSESGPPESSPESDGPCRKMARQDANSSDDGRLPGLLLPDAEDSPDE